MATLRSKGQITIPRAIREAARLEAGDPVEFELVPEGILLRPKKAIDASQAWFWTPEWQAKEREADEDYAAGRGEIFMSGEEFLAALKSRMKPLDADE
jgi:AbrB family looped-hinge helix DNA binding protein